MSDATARTVRLVKAQGIREASQKIRDNRYTPAETPWQRQYNFAMNDAADLLLEMAHEMEK
jgi:hypothetical protein